MEKFEKKDVLMLLEDNFNFLDDVMFDSKGKAEKASCSSFDYRKVSKDKNAIFFNDKEWKDPDAYSKLLYLCHEYLCHKSAQKLELKMSFISTYDEYNPSNYVLKESDVRLASDYIGPSGAIAFNEKVKKMKIGNFLSITRTFGGHILFPKHTSSINQRRATLFTDRIDLALEDIQKYYTKKKSRLVIEDDIDWFNKFSTFERFVDFFYLQDFMKQERNVDGTYAVKELAPFEDIDKSHSTMPVKFQEYIDNNVEAIKARNKRIIEALREVL